MASNSWADILTQEEKPVNESVKNFFEFFEQNCKISPVSPTTQLSEEDNNLESSGTEEKRLTNPFLTPSVFDDHILDQKSFFEKLLDNEEDLIRFDDSPQPSKQTNPFLGTLVDIQVDDSASFVASHASAVINHRDKESCKDLSDFLGSETQDSFVKESSFETQSECQTQNECEIAPYFDKCHWKEKEFITFRVSNIYHPNKFWIVPRYRELEMFMEYLREFYSKNKKSFRIRSPSVNTYSVVCHNNIYYRTLIIRFLPNDPHRLKVFLFDYGSIMVVHQDDVYYLPDVLCRIPQFAVRASLAYVAPKRTQVWTSEVVKVFEEFSSHKVLVGEVVHVDDVIKCLHLNIGDLPTEGNKMKYFNESLMDEGYAKFNFESTEPIHQRFDSKVEHLYIFPTFQMLETGGSPSNVSQFEALMSNAAAFNIVYGQYCTLR